MFYPGRILCNARRAALLFGTTTHYFIVFDPAHIKINPVSADVSFTDFKVAGRSLRIDSLVALKEIELE